MCSSVKKGLWAAGCCGSANTNHSPPHGCSGASHPSGSQSSSCSCGRRLLPSPLMALLVSSGFVEPFWFIPLGWKSISVNPSSASLLSVTFFQRMCVGFSFLPHLSSGCCVLLPARATSTTTQSLQLAEMILPVPLMSPCTCTVRGKRHSGSRPDSSGDMEKYGGGRKLGGRCGKIWMYLAVCRSQGKLRNLLSVPAAP